MTGIHRALAISFLEKYSLIGLTLISYVVIARLLTPEQIGLYSVATALIGIAQVVRDFGIGNYLIQEKNLTGDHIRTAFGLTLVIGGTMFLLFALGAPLIGDFYNDPRMTSIVRTVAWNFLIIPFGSVSMSLLRRDMQFGRLMVVNIAAAIAGFIATMGLAWAGWGAQSLAWGAIASNLTTGIGATLARTPRTLLLPSLSEWRTIVSFGGQSTLAGIVTSVAMDINDLVVGKLLGFAPVAILSRAQGLMNLFHRDLMGAIRNVAFPAFSQRHREGCELESAYIASTAAVTAFAWPFYGFIALYPLEILRLMFGPQWDAAVPLVPVFAAAGAVAATASLVLTLVMGVGRIDLVTKAEVFFQPARVVLVVLAALSFRSLEACAVALFIAYAVQVPILYHYKGKCIANDLPLLISSLSRSALVTCATLAAAVAHLFFVAQWDRSAPVALAEFLLVSLATVISWGISVIMLRHPIAADPLFQRLLGYLRLRTP